MANSLLGNQWAVSVIDSWILKNSSSIKSNTYLSEEIIRSVVKIIDRYTYGEYKRKNDPLTSDVNFLNYFERLNSSTFKGATYGYEGNKFNHNIFSSLESIIEENKLSDEQINLIGLFIFDILEIVGDYKIEK
jgi:hypothetical protein